MFLKSWPVSVGVRQLPPGDPVHVSDHAGMDLEDTPRPPTIPDGVRIASGFHGDHGGEEVGKGHLVSGLARCHASEALPHPKGTMSRWIRADSSSK